jgi:maleate cis-trans isomerase
MSKATRIGALVPATNPVVEPDFYSVVPREITVHFERMWNGRWGTQPEKQGDEAYKVQMTSEEANTVDWALFGMNVTEMNADVERGIRSLANVGPDLLVYACTSGTWHKGNLGFDREMSDLMQRAGGVPSITAVGSCLEAMRFMGTRRISVAGPYRNFHLQNRLKPLLEEAGFEVVSAEGEPWMQDSMNPREIDVQEPQVLIDFVPTVVKEEADTVFLPGTAWRAVEAAEELERILGKTVITVNQATIWMALRKVGWTKPVEGYGRLLRSLAPAG